MTFYGHSEKRNIHFLYYDVLSTFNFFLFCLASTNFTLVDKKVKNDVSTSRYNFLLIQKVKPTFQRRRTWKYFMVQKYKIKQCKKQTRIVFCSRCTNRRAKRRSDVACFSTRDNVLTMHRVGKNCQRATLVGCEKAKFPEIS